MFLAFALALAGDLPATAPVPAEPEKKVCKWQEAPTGSNMPGKKTCRTKSEWAEIDRANSKNADRYKRDRAQGNGMPRQGI